MLTHKVAAETEMMLAWLASHGGRYIDTFDESVVVEAICEGLVEHVTIGCDEPTLFLTPLGKDHAQLGSLGAPTGHPLSVEHLSII